METPVCPYSALSSFPRALPSRVVKPRRWRFKRAASSHRRICATTFRVLIVAVDKTLGVS
jgi:hypothetical protein